MSSRCLGCSAAVVWAETLAGKRGPYDAQPTVDGTHTIVGGRASFVPEAKRRGQLYTSHFATCPEAKRFRGGRAAARAAALVPAPSSAAPEAPRVALVAPDDIELVLNRLGEAGAFLVDGDTEAMRRAARLHLMSGQPYRFRCGEPDRYANFQGPSIAASRAQGEVLDRWMARRVGPTAALVWRRVGEEFVPLGTGLTLTVWAELVLTEEVLHRVAQVVACAACDGSGHTAPTDDRCGVCRGHGRVALRGALARTA